MTSSAAAPPPGQALPGIATLTNGIPNASTRLSPDRSSLAESTRDSGTWPQPQSKRKSCSSEALLGERHESSSAQQRWRRDEVIFFESIHMGVLLTAIIRQLRERPRSTSAHPSQPRLTTSKLHPEHTTVCSHTHISTLGRLAATFHQPRVPS